MEDNDNEVFERVGKVYQQYLNSVSEADFKINKHQLNEFLKVLSFFVDAAEQMDGNIQVAEIRPKDTVGWVSATFMVFNITGDDMARFCNVVRSCSAITIDSMVDGRICISCTIPEVFDYVGNSEEE